MQIMGHSSAESPSTLGFSWFDWKCSPLINTEGRRVFHTGWNMVASSGGEGFCKELVNEVKNREWFRPFAGTVMAEHAHEWFDLASKKESPSMMYAVDVVAGKQDLIPAITQSSELS